MDMQPEETESKRPQLRAVTEDEGGVEVPQNQNPTVMEIPDSTSECDEGSRCSPVKTEERSFVASLHCFMKGRGTPIERIPHLGFKQINLWRIYKAVEKLGGYDSVTARRLWKSVYDELGGSPGSTSAATCTRRHYERLLLPFERQLRGEEDKPLPPTKPRKQYKRGMEGKDCKSEGKRKRGQLDKETDSAVQESPEPGHCETVTRVHSAPWTIPSDKPRPQTHEDGDDRSHTVYAHAHLIPDPTAPPWSCHVASAGGEVISPLEKKKRVAQASLGLPQSPRQDDCKDRPSVIRCSQSPGLPPVSRASNSSEGSPLPCSSSSSRSSSPYSVSSEDCAVQTDDRPSAPDPELPLNYSTNRLSPASGYSGAHKPQSCSLDVKDPAGSSGLTRNAPLGSPLPVDAVSTKGQSKQSVWSPVCGGTSRRTAHYRPPPTPCTYTVKSVWLPSSSTTSFTKVHPKPAEPLRPIPFQPAYRPLQNPNRAMHHDDSPTYAMKLHMAPRPYHAEKKERSRTALPKPLSTQQPVFHPNAGIPVSYLAAYERAGRDTRHPLALHPLLVPTSVRLPQAQSSPVYRHVMMGPTNNAPYEPALYSYPYPIPLWNPQAGFSFTGANAPYPHTRL